MHILYDPPLQYAKDPNQIGCIMKELISEQKKSYIYILVSAMVHYTRGASNAIGVRNGGALCPPPPPDTLSRKGLIQRLTPTILT